MHLVGDTLCMLLHRSEFGAAFDLRAALGPAAPRVLLCDKCLADHDVEELQNLFTALQLEFGTLYALEEAGPDGPCVLSLGVRVFIKGFPSMCFDFDQESTGTPQHSLLYAFND
jgi:hypothetical protein